MIKAVASVKTPNASRYLQQLCKHFRHKVPAEFTETDARVDFPFGLCIMKAEQSILVIDCESADSDSFGRLRFVLDDHLERFAWKEALKLEWTEREAQ